jgi:hypothetical protein
MASLLDPTDCGVPVIFASLEPNPVEAAIAGRDSIGIKKDPQ